jgi:hypothetical protein
VYSFLFLYLFTFKCGIVDALDFKRVKRAVINNGGSAAAVSFAASFPVIMDHTHQVLDRRGVPDSVRLMQQVTRRMMKRSLASAPSRTR